MAASSNDNASQIVLKKIRNFCTGKSHFPFVQHSADLDNNQTNTTKRMFILSKDTGGNIEQLITNNVNGYPSLSAINDKYSNKNGNIKQYCGETSNYNVHLFMRQDLKSQKYFSQNHYL